MSLDPTIVNAADEAPDWGAWALQTVRKIVLGELDKEPKDFGQLPDDFGIQLESLTHLHLWGMSDLKSLDSLPQGLKCLDIRKCPSLVELPELPDSLEELILESLPGLQELHFPGRSLQDLWDLSLKGNINLTQASIHAALWASPSLRIVDFSGCEQLEEIRAWPAELRRIELNGCVRFKRLPGEWPAELVRLGLRNVKQLRTLPSFERWPEYLDLAGAESLTRIDRPGDLRTLFLHGSGLLVPPATEHGKSPNENIAERTLDFYNDVDVCGTGEVKRSKLLVLGNGEAGKTCLSLALAPGLDPKQATVLGSTHGLQFWSWTQSAVIKDTFKPVQLQLWDFGGQEIYHQTHRLFMGKGAVFVVVWNPEQDGKESKPTSDGYRDEWRPLRYWLDLIHLSCPWKPRIAIVCSHYTERSDELEKRWKAQVPEEHKDQYECFYIDSLTGKGQLQDLERWVETKVGEVVETQGTAVPAHWEIAQDLVASWFREVEVVGGGKRKEPEYDQLDFDLFSSKLLAEIHRRLDQPRFGLLRSSVESGAFELDEKRVRRVLEFLTNSGWIYWDEALFERRLIIGQQWALEGIYAVLDRREDSRIYRELRRTDGQFTASRLDELVWKERGFNKAQQQLLLSFMKGVGVCFELVSGEKSLWGEPVFKTLQHLPTARELSLQRRFERKAGGNVELRQLKCTQLHLGHWHAILGALGETYGTDGKYASDGFDVVNSDGQHILITKDIEGGLGGLIEVQVAGPDAEARLDVVCDFVLKYLPGAEEASPSAREGEDRAGPKPDRIRLFVSYAWNPVEEQVGSGLIEEPVPQDYEAPVRILVEALRMEDSSVELLYDKTCVGREDNVKSFLTLASSTDKVLVVHSDKYWRSWYCMYEFWIAWRSLTERPVMRDEVFLLVAHPSSRIEFQDALDSYAKHWDDKPGFPTALRGGPNRLGVTKDELTAAAKNVLVNVLPAIEGERRSFTWNADSPGEVLDMVHSKLGIERSSKP